MNDTELLKKIDTAAAAVNKTEKIVADAQADRVAKCKALGSLLLEAKKRHPATKDFEAFLKCAKHVKLAAAYDYMKLAGGRNWASGGGAIASDDEIRQAEQARRGKQRARKQKSRSRLPPPKPVSVTDPDVTESVPTVALPNAAPETAEQSATRRTAENAALFDPATATSDKLKLVADIAFFAGEVKRCTEVIADVSGWLAGNRTKLHRDDLAYLTELAVGNVNKADALVETLRTMRKVKV